MNYHAYDTLGTSKKLAAAGMERRQAEAVAIAIAERQGDLATKSDIENLESDIKRLESDIKRLESDIKRLDSSISSLRTEFKSDMNSFRSEIRSEMKTQFRWLMTMQIAVIFAIVTLAYADI